MTTSDTPMIENLVEIPDSLRPLLENRGDRPLPPWLLDQLLSDGSQPIPVVFEPAANPPQPLPVEQDEEDR